MTMMRRGDEADANRAQNRDANRDGLMPARSRHRYRLVVIGEGATPEIDWSRTLSVDDQERRLA